jgi:Ca2+-binding RTX toxin-like protein
MHIESLESRRMFSATLANGILTIAGTPADDRISLLRSKDGKLTVTEKAEVQKPDGAGSVATVEKTVFKLADVTRIVITAGDGSDSITVAGTKKYPLAIPASIDAGAGRDFVTGGGANDTLLGGDGDDRLTGNAGDDQLFGGAGKDRLYGNPGADQLDGGFDNDRLYADDGDGHDTVFGGGAPPGAEAPNDYAVVDAVDTVLTLTNSATRSVKRVKIKA